MLLTELFALYYRKRLRLSSPHTSRLYLHSIKAFSETLGKPAEIADLTDDNLENHLYRLVNEGLSPATANKDRAQLSALWRFANRHRLTDTWPEVQSLREPERVPLGWLTHELDALFSAVDSLDGDVAGVPASLWWSCLLSVLLDTGERIGAIRRLTRDNFHHTHILVPATVRKGKTRDRLYELSPDTLIKLRQLLKKHTSELVFPWDRHENHIYFKYRRILKKAGLPANAKAAFHKCRRTVASAVANQGGDPTAALDHSSPRVTKVYLDPRIVKRVSTSQLVRAWRAAATD